jgi:hypothetical protein
MKEPRPIAIQLRSAMALTLERTQPIESSSGLRNTASEKSVPMAIVMMTKAAPSTTQP